MMLHRKKWTQAAGFAVICLMAAGIVGMCLHKRLYTAAISDVFNLSMDMLGTLACALLCYGCISVKNHQVRIWPAFSSLLFVNALVLFLDALMWFADGNPAMRLLNLMSSVSFYMTVNTLMYLFWRYACAVLRPAGARPERLYAVMRGLLLFTLMLCLTNFFTPVLFRVSSDGVFEKAWGYSIGSGYILIVFILLAAETARSQLEKWKKASVMIFATVSVVVFMVTAYQPQFAIAYTVTVMAVLMANCVIFIERVRLKELVIRIFTLLLLCAMLIYGPTIYLFSRQKAIREGYESAKGIFTLTAHVLDDVGLGELSDPDNTALYQSVRTDMRILCRAFNLQNLYVETIDTNEGTRSFVIAVASSDEEDKIVLETLGWPGASVWSDSSFLTETELLALAGEYTDRYSEQNNSYGHNLDWFYPYKGADGQVLALIGADIDVEKQQAETIKNSIRELVPVLLLYFVTLVVLLILLDRAFLKPIFMISRYIQGFFADGNKKTEPLSVKGGYEIWFLSKSFDFMTSELNEYEQNRTRDIQEKQRIETELGMASSIQAHFLPNSFPPFPNRREFDIFASMNPAKEVGGDFYDFFFVDDDHLAMAVADVSGKGVPAALFMMITRALLKSAAQMGFSPAGVLEKINEQLAADNEDNMFVTVWFGILEISTGSLTFADAGHELMMLYSEGKWQLIPKKTGLPLAVFSPRVPADPLHPVEYRDQCIQLQPGDMIFQYTDGITEATNIQDELFGEDRVVQAADNSPSSDPQTLVNHIRSQIDAFARDVPQFDDMTMLCLKYHGSQQS